MSKAPDLHVIDFHAAHRQLGHQPAQGEVGLGPIQQPVTQIPGQQPGLMTANLPSRDRPSRWICWPKRPVEWTSSNTPERKPS